MYINILTDFDPCTCSSRRIKALFANILTTLVLVILVFQELLQILPHQCGTDLYP